MAEYGMGLANLKKEYGTLQKKYKLPEFREMNEDFYIEKIAENETDILLREIRRLMGDKLANYMRFLENLLNPANVPMFVYAIVKVLTPEDKKKISEAYRILVKNEIQFIECDLEFNEAKEAEFIRKSFDLWQHIKKDLKDAMKTVERDVDLKEPAKDRNNYFG